MKFLIRIGGELRVVNMWHCSDGNVYIEGRYVEEVGTAGEILEPEGHLRRYCTENGYEFIGSLFTNGS